MKNATTDVLGLLAERGYRITRSRREMYRLLRAATSPLTIQELAARTASNETSAYRFMSLLKHEGLVEEILIRDSKPKYALDDHHHHHIVCIDCGYVAHVPCATPPTRPKHVSGFAEVREHEVTFYGTCTRCG